MKNAVSYLLILFSSFLTVAYAADSLSIPKFHPSSVTAYDIDEGLPMSCLDNVMLDSKGRLWLNPCTAFDIYQSLNFFQFDGDKSFDVPLASSKDSDTPLSWKFQGLTSQELIFGINQDTTKSFLFNADIKEQKVFSFGEGEKVRSLIAGDHNEVFAFTESPEFYGIYQLNWEGKSRLTTIKITLKNRRYGIQDIDATKTGETLWFLISNKGFIGYSLRNNVVKQYSWLELLDNRTSELVSPVDSRLELRMTSNSKGDLLFYIGELRSLYIFDINRETLNIPNDLQEILNTIIERSGRNSSKVDFFKDKSENILLTINWAPFGYHDDFAAKTLLIDPEGQIFDYTSVAEMTSAGRFRIGLGKDHFSNDFKKNIFITTGGGLIVVDVKVNLPIENKFQKRACRQIASIGKDSILLITDDAFRGVADLNHPETQQVTKASKYSPFLETHSTSQLVHRDNKLWFPSIDSSLQCFDLEEKIYRDYPIGESFAKFNFSTKNEVILVSFKHDVFIYKLDQKTLIPFGGDSIALNIHGTANEVYIAKDRTIWIASLNGLWRLDAETKSAQKIGKEKGFVDERIMCISEAEDGKLWLGTFGGVHVYDPQTGELKIIDQATGLSNNAVVGILIDEEGDRWVSTFDGLSVISPEGEVLFELSENEGITHREFNRFSYLKTQEGKMIFGTVAGISILDPLEIKRKFLQNEEIQIYITSIAYYDREKGIDVRLTGDFDQLPLIQLPPTHRYLEIDFGISDYIDPQNNTFSYRIVRDDITQGKSEEVDIWTNIGADAKLVLNDLPIGDYKVIIRGLNAKGQWTQHPIILSIHVSQFFYKTWWFYLLCTLPFLLAAFFWIRRLQTERERLESEVQIRTLQIEKDKQTIQQHAFQLKELDELKSRFFTNISHEFRTPLTVINGMAAEIKEDSSKKVQEAGTLILRNGKNLLNLINQILDLRKLEAGKMSLNLVHGNIIHYLNYITESFRSMAEMKDIRIHFLVPSSPIEMDYDPDKFRQILSNLLSNALKYTESNGDVYIQIDRREDNAKAYLVLQVRDTGRGISAEALPYVFDRFYQVENLATHKPQGTGVGLSLTQELVKLMEGSIEVDSEVGKGATFSIVVPITENATKQAEPMQNGLEAELSASLITTIDISANPEPSLEQQPNLPTVLIVEDNMDVRQYLKSCLEGSYQMMEAKDGLEGIEEATEQIPDLIISDVMMPRKDGFELCDTLKNDERTSHIPIILLTAKADFDAKISGLQKGADAYLIKPFEKKELLIRIEKLLLLREKLQQHYMNQAMNEQDLSESTKRTKEDEFIIKVRETILEHISEDDFNIQRLCRLIGLGRSQLHKKLKALTGQSTSAFMRSIRLHKAKELLQTTDLNVSEVSYEVGIGNPDYFSRIYKEMFGQSPSKEVVE